MSSNKQNEKSTSNKIGGSKKKEIITSIPMGKAKNGIVSSYPPPKPEKKK